MNGEDGYPLLKERIREPQIPEERSDARRFALRLLEATGYLIVCPEHCQMLWEHDETMVRRRKGWENLEGRLERLARVWDVVDKMVGGAPFDEADQ